MLLLLSDTHLFYRRYGYNGSSVGRWCNCAKFPRLSLLYTPVRPTHIAQDSLGKPLYRRCNLHKLFVLSLYFFEESITQFLPFEKAFWAIFALYRCILLGFPLAGEPFWSVGSNRTAYAGNVCLDKVMERFVCTLGTMAFFENCLMALAT